MANNQSSVRETNIHAVLSQIINNPEISRAQIAKNTRLNKATISEIVRDLIDTHYVIETGVGNSTISGGRKPIFLKINKNAGISFNFDIRYDRLSYMTTHLNGEVIEIVVKDMYIDKKNVVDVLEKIINDYRETMPSLPFGIIGVVIAVHGVVSDNRSVFTPYYDLQQVDLANELNHRLELPVYLENEANLAALADVTFNAKRNNIITCSIHTGVGAGIIINGKLYRGYGGRGGEVGHSTLYPGGIKCACGNEGCLEQYCSQTSLLSFYRRSNQNEGLTLDDLVADYYDGNVLAVKIINEFTKNLSVGMNNLLKFYGPEEIYINSKIVNEIPVIVDMLKEKLEPLSFNRVPIKVSRFGEDASLYGATIMNLQNFLQVETISIQIN